MTQSLLVQSLLASFDSILLAQQYWLHHRGVVAQKYPTLQMSPLLLIFFWVLFECTSNLDDKVYDIRVSKLDIQQNQ